jgi:hypothetical protein
MSGPEQERAPLWDKLAALLRRWWHAASIEASPSGNDGSSTSSDPVATSSPSPRTAEAPADSAQFEEILSRLEAIERHLFDPGAPSPRRLFSESDIDELTNLARQLFDSQQQSLARLIVESITAGLNRESLPAGDAANPTPQPAASPVPVEPYRPACSMNGGDEPTWRDILFGSDLEHESQAAAQIDELVQRLHRRDSAALQLSGQLMIFQGSPPERRPQWLKEIGEAYYRCFPKTSGANDPLESALIRWLERECEATGFPVVVAPVQPGERFDSSRHVVDGSAGVEITDVLGWVVLRGRDKVYTKAVSAH